MKPLLLLSIVLTCGIAPLWGSTPVMIQDFEKAEPPSSVWVVGIPNENASVQLSTDHPFEGKQCLQAALPFHRQWAIPGCECPVKKIQAPIHKLHFMLYGDNSGVRLRGLRVRRQR